MTTRWKKNKLRLKSWLVRDILGFPLTTRFNRSTHPDSIGESSRVESTSCKLKKRRRNEIFEMWEMTDWLLIHAFTNKRLGMNMMHFILAKFHVTYWIKSACWKWEWLKIRRDRLHDIFFIFTCKYPSTFFVFNKLDCFYYLELQ